jgi:hypothetical protein
MKMIIELANEKDDFQLKEILKKVFMKGNISIAFETEPSFFQAIQVQGKNKDVFVLKDSFNAIHGFGIRAIKPLHVNNKVLDVGYLSSLRLKKESRNNLWLSKGYGFLKKLDSKSNIPFYLSTIISDNKKAISILESRRANLPNYQKLGKYITYLIPKQKVKLSKEFEIYKGDDFSLNEILNFINFQGKKKQFFPKYKKEDFNSSYLKDLNLNDFYIACKNNKIVGVLALWDQSKFKQTRIVGYSNLIKFLRLINNFFSYFFNLSKLIKKNELVNSKIVTMPACVNNDPEILKFLISHALKELSSDNLLIGLSTQDNLALGLKKLKKRKYLSNIYVVSFEDFDISSLKQKVPYLELGSL